MLYKLKKNEELIRYCFKQLLHTNLTDYCSDRKLIALYQQLLKTYTPSEEEICWRKVALGKQIYCLPKNLLEILSPKFQILLICQEKETQNEPSSYPSR